MLLYYIDYIDVFSGDSLWSTYQKFTNLCYKKIAYIKYEMIDIVVVLIVLIVKIAVSLIHANIKNSAWYCYLYYFYILSKAFEKIWNEGVLYKLNSNGISGKFYKLMVS